MPRRKRYDKINSYHLAKIDREIALLRITLREAGLMLKPFCAHDDAIGQLHNDLHRALNLLNDRPADYREPHRGHMAQG